MKEKFVRFFSEISNLNVYLYTFCVCLGAVVLLSQVGLLINPIRNTLTVVDVLDGKISGNTDTKCGFVTLMLTNGTPSENILIYLNGIEYDVFDADVKTIELYENTVIEIYSKEIIKINIFMKRCFS